MTSPYFQNFDEAEEDGFFDDIDVDELIEPGEFYAETNPEQDTFNDYQTITTLSLNRPQPKVLQTIIPTPISNPHQEIFPILNNFDIPLVPVADIPSKFRNIFSSFPYFNYVQSTVFKDVFNSDKNLVISAPTSSGKTVILELAIIRLLISLNNPKSKFKIIYMAPIKALCTEKFREWSYKFGELHNLKVIELTGDTETWNDSALETANIICTTPEKWDLITRKSKNRISIMNEIKLFLVDEIHILGESSRGACIEAVISRMKKLAYSNCTGGLMLRFLAISATIPNIEDFATWLSCDLNNKKPAIKHKLNENYRPVKLEKVVLGYYCSPATSDFCFDLSLNYKLASVIKDHSESKPTLIFCSTRKGTLQAAQTLAKSNLYFRGQDHKKILFEQTKTLKDPKIRELIVNNGIGVHHAGMDVNDRHVIESLFLNSNLYVLFSTSTLAIGVNLPAHLVIIKSTKHYICNKFVDYSTTQILQMIGRAGRPQFDKSATAVIMTKQSDRLKYENLVEGNQLIESQLHQSLIEHLNVEICLRTICNLNEAINWLKSTFLYARLLKNPSYYGLNLNLTNGQGSIDDYLSKLCIQNLNNLMSVNLIEECNFEFDPIDELKPTPNGHLMAKYCLLFDTMKSLILNLSNLKKNQKQPTKSLSSLIVLLSESKEFEDIKLRTNEKSLLNSLNNNGKVIKAKKGVDEELNNRIIRFITDGKIKTPSMKICVLIQAQFGSIPITDFSLNQDIYRIFRISQRISKCMLEFLTNNSDVRYKKNYETFINTIMLNKCLTARLWFDSPHIFRQFNRIGLALSQTFVDKSMISFKQVLELNEHEIERRLNKNPPFGFLILDTARKLPYFKIECEHTKQGECVLKIVLENFEFLSKCEDGGVLGSKTPFSFIVGDEENNLIVFNRLNLEQFLVNGVWSKKLTFNQKTNGCWIHVSLILLNFVGLDVHESYEIFEANEPQAKPTPQVEKPKKMKPVKEIQLKLAPVKTKRKLIVVSSSDDESKPTEGMRKPEEVRVDQVKKVKSNDEIVTFDDFMRNSPKVEQPRLFKFRVKESKENTPDVPEEVSVSKEKEFSIPKIVNTKPKFQVKSILKGVYNYN